MEETSNHNTWHKRCQLWVEPFSLYISHFFPMEYIYGHWFQYIKTEDCKIKMFSSHLPIHWQIPCGSRMEGVFIPEVHKIRVIFIISFSCYTLIRVGFCFGIIGFCIILKRWQLVGLVG